MIPNSLALSLIDDIVKPQMAAKKYLYAIVDMAEVPEDGRLKLMTAFEGAIFPLLLEKEYAAFQSMGAHLIASNGYDHNSCLPFFRDLEGCNSDIISGWITCTLPVQSFIAHLRNATFANDAAGKEYVLRYYDPSVLPVLANHADKSWWRWFFSPILSWWVSAPTSIRESWQRLPGSASTELLEQPFRLQIDEPLWQALVSDSLPPLLLASFETHFPDLFKTKCRGVRLKQVEEKLSVARALGLEGHASLVDYVLRTLQDKGAQLDRDPDWKHAIQHAVTTKGRLDDIYFSKKST